MQLVTNNGISYYQFEHLSRLRGVSHAVFTRRAGHSNGPFRSFNVARGIGDDDRSVAKNRGIIARCFNGDRLLFSQQVHGDQVLVVDHGHEDDLQAERPAALVGDALVTDQRRARLVIQVADCQAVLLVDPERQVIANVHAGWRGSIKNIIGSTVATMATHFGCRARNILAGVSPSLGPCCAEFINYRKEIPEDFWAYKDERDHFDFWAISHDQLVACGLRSENIAISRICTKCSTDLFFSYRGEGTTGRFAAVIGLD